MATARKYNGLTFIPKGQLNMGFSQLSKHTRHNPVLNQFFNKSNGTWDYDDFYLAMDSEDDIFAIEELNNLLVIPSSNYLFQFDK